MSRSIIDLFNSTPLPLGLSWQFRMIVVDNDLQVPANDRGFPIDLGFCSVTVEALVRDQDTEPATLSADVLTPQLAVIPHGGSNILRAQLLVSTPTFTKASVPPNISNKIS